MKQNVTSMSCEICGGLFPLKPIHTRHNQHCSRPSKRRNAHHSSTEQGLIKKCKCLEECLLLSNDSKIRESSLKMQSYDSLLEEIQAIFANQKVKKETILPYIYQACICKEHIPNKLIQHKKCQAHQNVISQSKHKLPSKSPSPINLPCFLHTHQGQHNIELSCKSSIGSQSNESSCKRSMIDHNNIRAISIASQSNEFACIKKSSQIPHDASNCSFDPLRLSPSPQNHVAQCSSHHLSEHNAREKAQEKLATKSTSQICKSHHGVVDNYQDATCSTLKILAKQNTQFMINNDCNHDVSQFYKKCQIHQTNEHMIETLISNPKNSAKRSQEHVCEQTRPQLQQSQKIMYSCHQHIAMQCLERCHLHPQDNHNISKISNHKTKNSRQCQRCGCVEGEFCNPKEEISLLESPNHVDCKAYMKTRRSPEHKVIAWAQKLSPRCKLHGNYGEIDFCELCCHLEKDHRGQQKNDCGLSLEKENIKRCNLHGLLSPKSQELKYIANSKCKDFVRCKDPLVWVPKRVQKQKPYLPLHWLDQIIASQKYPSDIIQQFLQSKRKCPPLVKKPKCLACLAKCLKTQPQETSSIFNTNLCEREVGLPWNSSSDIAASIECKEPKRGKLSRLVLSRTLIIMPVVKLSPPLGPWTTRKEFQVCSECRNPMVTKSKRWKSVLEEISNIPKKCSSKSSCQTIHGLVLPNDTNTQAIDLHCPQLYSTFCLYSKLRKVQIEMFDRNTALQIAQTKGIELDKEIFDQLLPEHKKPKRASPQKKFKKSPRIYVCKQQQKEVYRDLCKIVDPPTPVYSMPQCIVRDVEVQVGNPSQPLENVYKWNPSDFVAMPCLPAKPSRQSNLQPCAPNHSFSTCWLEKEQPHCQEQDESWDEQHWANLVEACKQVRMEQGVYGNCAAC